MAAPKYRHTAFDLLGRVVRSRGFTLIELMIVVAIIAILSAIAYPTYISYITKTRRAAATACLSEYANYMERFYTTNLRYDQDVSTGKAITTLPTLDCETSSQTGDSYSYAFGAGQPQQATYTIQATPINAQLTRDTTCGTLAINQAGQRFYQGATADTTGMCWKN